MHVQVAGRKQEHTNNTGSNAAFLALFVVAAGTGLLTGGPAFHGSGGCVPGWAEPSPRLAHRAFSSSLSFHVRCGFGQVPFLSGS